MKQRHKALIHPPNLVGKYSRGAKIPIYGILLPFAVHQYMPCISNLPDTIAGSVSSMII
jgi:hypothetical protein